MNQPTDKAFQGVGCLVLDQERRLDSRSHLKVNLVSVPQNFVEDICDVFLLDAILEKDHVGNALKELPVNIKVALCVITS